MKNCNVTLELISYLKPSFFSSVPKQYIGVKLTRYLGLFLVHGRLKLNEISKIGLHEVIKFEISERTWATCKTWLEETQKGKVVFENNKDFLEVLGRVLRIEGEVKYVAENSKIHSE